MKLFTWMALAMAVVGLQVGCAGPVQTVAVHGDNLLVVDADQDDVAGAVMSVHNQMAAWIPGENGSKSDPTYSASSRMWKSGPLDEPDKKVTYIRSEIEFDDKQGQTIRIEEFHPHDGPSFVFIEYNGEGGPSAVTNQLLAELQSRGIEPR